MEDTEPAGPTRESYGRLFLRFLRFGALAWGGPVAQIALIKSELVDRERWISTERFNRTLAVYQVLPGPEAHELCVYFGTLARGRVGGVLAGVGFMLPGFLLVSILAALYVRAGITGAAALGLFAGLQPAVAALIVRAVVRIGRHILRHRLAWGIAALAVLAEAGGAPFWIPLVFGAIAGAAGERRRWGVLLAAVVGTAIALAVTWGPAAVGPVGARAAVEPSLGALAIMGLRAGLLTFGGAYTAIPFVRADAVGAGWLTDGQFLDALALSGAVPAPLIIFGTFVGYVGGGFAGALVVTACIFLPAFAFTLVGHRQLERLVHHPAAHGALDGVAAAVVGLIAVTAVRLLPTAIPDVTAGVIFAGASVALWRWRSPLAIPVVIIGAGLLGTLLAVR